MMARVVTQSALLTTPIHAPSKQMGRLKRSVKMACGLETPPLKIRSDSISLGKKLVRVGQDFRSPITLSSRPGSGNGCVANDTRFEGFTGKALEAIMIGREESIRLGDDFIGIEQILLGLIGEGTGIAAEVLKSSGIKLKDVRDQVEKISPRGKGCYALGLPFTSIAASALVHSFEEARKRGHNHIGREHLLLVLLRQRVVSGVLKNLGTDSSNIYTQVIHMVGGDEVSIVTQGSTGNRKMPTLEGYGTNLTTLVGEGGGSTTIDEYNEHTEKDPTLAMPSLPVEVHEPSVDETILILKRVQEHRDVKTEHYEIRHKLHYSDGALIAAAELSYQYISDRFLPDKAMDLIDEAGARVCARHAQFFEATRELRRQFVQNSKSIDAAVHRTVSKYGDSEVQMGEFFDREKELMFQINVFHEVNKAEKVVTEVDVQDVVSSWTGIPVEKVIIDESARLIKMEKTFHKRVIGQDEAVKAVSRACVCLRNPNQPIASFFFYGPSGVGKSELAKALAANYFGSEEAVIRIDRSEFEGLDAVSRLIGSHPGYTKGGQLTEVVRRRPYSVVTFEGIGYDPGFLNMIRQILEYGWLLDGKGRRVDFSNTIVIVTYTSDREIENGRQLGFDLEQDCRYNRIKSLVKQRYYANIINSFDDVIVFRQLTKLEVKEIAGVMLKGLSDRLKEKGIQLYVTGTFRDKVVDKGYDSSVVQEGRETQGAWPLCRAIRHLGDSVAEKMVAGELKEGESVTVDADSDGNVVLFNGGSGAL